VRIRQLALVARRLAPLADDLRAVLDLGEPFHDPGVAEFGLENAVYPVGDAFLEVVAPVRADTAGGRFLDRRGGDGGYMVLLQTGDLAAARARAEGEGVRVVWEIALPDIAAVHLHPRDLGGAIASLDQPKPPESWRWGGPGWEGRVRIARVHGLAGAELEARDPAAMAERWGAVVARPARARDAGAREIALDGGWLRFVPERSGRGEGLAAIALRAHDPGAVLAAARERGLAVEDDAFSLGGVEWRLRGRS